MDQTPSPIAMRSFGQAADLDLDFSDADRPQLVTAVLAQCADHHDPSYWWSQPVGRRTAALLRLVRLTEGNTHLALCAACSAASCGETFGFELPLHGLALAGDEADTDSINLQLDEQHAVTVRRPTGEDLRRWRWAQPATRAEATCLMLNTLVTAGTVTSADEAAVSALIANRDPLVDFTVSCHCPVCGMPNDVQVDLEGLALTRLANRQKSLLQDIHCLASHYGWTENQVLAVPATRRAHYLALIEGGA